MPGPLQYERTTTFEDSRTGGVTSVAFSPTGSFLASAGLDHRVCIWSVENGRLLHNFVTASTVLSLAWVPVRDGMLLCGCQDGSIVVLTAPSQVRNHVISAFYIADYKLVCTTRFYIPANAFLPR